MSKLHIWPQESESEGASVVRSAVIEADGYPSQKLWYRFSEEHESHLTESCDPFLVACVLMGMARNSALCVHGQTSPSLIANLFDFQNAWQCWRPDTYRKVDIVADTERETLSDIQAGS